MKTLNPALRATLMPLLFVLAIILGVSAPLDAQTSDQETLKALLKPELGEAFSMLYFDADVDNPPSLELTDIFTVIREFEADYRLDLSLVMNIGNGIRDYRQTYTSGVNSIRVFRAQYNPNVIKTNSEIEVLIIVTDIGQPHQAVFVHEESSSARVFTFFRGFYDPEVAADRDKNPYYAGIVMTDLEADPYQEPAVMNAANDIWPVEFENGYKSMVAAWCRRSVYTMGEPYLFYAGMVNLSTPSEVLARRWRNEQAN